MGCVRPLARGSARGSRQTRLPVGGQLFKTFYGQLRALNWRIRLQILRNLLPARRVSGRATRRLPAGRPTGAGPAGAVREPARGGRRAVPDALSVR